MKKVLVAIITLAVILCSVAVAETDLSSMSYDELVTLQKKIVLEIMSRPEWKEVKVPTGDWTVGEDIPAGTYSIKCDSDYSMALVVVREKDKIVSSYALADDSPLGKLELKDGWTVNITYSVVFSPYVSLGF